mmetsp:Transcript_12196/g.15094  ORF Transcript_12196/g.15094 Transcript_12196/m.15094 type:complete len:625 (+) Transcript_12196:98-1972(+)
MKIINTALTTIVALTSALQHQYALAQGTGDGTESSLNAATDLKEEKGRSSTEGIRGSRKKQQMLHNENTFSSNSRLNSLTALSSEVASHWSHRLQEVRNMQNTFHLHSDHDGDNEIVHEEFMMYEEDMDEEKLWSRSRAIPKSEGFDIELEKEMLTIQKGEYVVVPKEKDHADVRVTSSKEILEKLHDMQHRALTGIHNTTSGISFENSDIHGRAGQGLPDYFTDTDWDTVGKALAFGETDGGLEQGLDLLASTVVMGLCFAASWAAAGPTMGVSVAAAPLTCAAAAFWSGIIFSAFSWIDGIFGTPSNDDAWWSVEAAESRFADGNSLAISYHRNGEVDKDSLGYIAKGEVKESREDLDAKDLIAIEVSVENTNDVCVKNMLFRVGKEPSGTGSIEELSIPAAMFTYLTDTQFHNTEQRCIYFGDAEGAIGNFKFHWPSALTCHKNFGAYFTLDYVNCLSWATYRYDVRRNGRFQRFTYSNNPSLPSYFASPMQMIRSQSVSSLCIDIFGNQLSNYDSVGLWPCHGQSNQRFDFDADGRLRSASNPTICLESGSAGTLYSKVYVYFCSGREWQQWVRYTDGRIQNKYNGMYIGTAYCKREGGALLELRNYEDGACGEAQKFSW